MAHARDFCQDLPLQILASHLEIIVLRNIRDADDQYAHFPTGTMNSSWRNMNEGTFRNRVFDSVENHAAGTFDNVVKLRRALVVMELRAVNIYRMNPCRWLQKNVLAANEAITPTTSAALPGGVALVPNQERAGNLVRLMNAIH